MTKTEIADATESTPENVRKLLAKMIRDGLLIKKGDKYQPPSNIDPTDPGDPGTHN